MSIKTRISKWSGKKLKEHPYSSIILLLAQASTFPVVCMSQTSKYWIKNSKNSNNDPDLECSFLIHKLVQQWFAVIRKSIENWTELLVQIFFKNSNNFDLKCTIPKHKFVWGIVIPNSCMQLYENLLSLKCWQKSVAFVCMYVYMHIHIQEDCYVLALFQLQDNEWVSSSELFPFLDSFSLCMNFHLKFEYFFISIIDNNLWKMNNTTGLLGHMIRHHVSLDRSNDYRYHQWIPNWML